MKFIIALALLGTSVGTQALTTDYLAKRTSLHGPIKVSLLKGNPPQRGLFQTEQPGQTEPIQPDPGHPNPGPIEPAPIARNLNLKISVQKMKLTKEADGSWTFSVNPVCQLNEVIPVYDFRQGMGSILPINGYTCASDYFGRPVSLSISANAYLVTDQVHPGEPMTDLKVVDAGLFFEDQGKPLHTWQQGKSRDLNVPSLIIEASQQFGQINCDPAGNCTPDSDEAFSATVEFMEQP